MDLPYKLKREAAELLGEGVCDLMKEVLIKHNIAVLEASKESIDDAVKNARVRVINILRDAINEFVGSEQARHPMFSEGYDYALLHMGEILDGLEKNMENHR